jgi:hypothetical protein
MRNTYGTDFAITNSRRPHLSGGRQPRRLLSILYPTAVSDYARASANCLAVWQCSGHAHRQWRRTQSDVGERRLCYARCGRTLSASVGLVLYVRHCGARRQSRAQRRASSRGWFLHRRGSGLVSVSTYTIAENGFMASGGDGYPVLISRATTRNVMANDVADYVTASSPITPAIQGRVNCTSSGATICPTVFS